MRLIATKKVDEIGRIMLPRSLRAKYRIKTSTSIDICVDDSGQIVLRKVEPCCVICGKMDDLKKLDSRDCVCIHCRARIREID